MRTERSMRNLFFSSELTQPLIRILYKWVNPGMDKIVIPKISGFNLWLILETKSGYNGISIFYQSSVRTSAHRAKKFMNFSG
jgi:hypothetical protein